MKIKKKDEGKMKKRPEVHFFFVRKIK